MTNYDTLLKDNNRLYVEYADLKAQLTAAHATIDALKAKLAEAEKVIERIPKDGEDNPR